MYHFLEFIITNPVAQWPSHVSAPLFNLTHKHYATMDGIGSVSTIKYFEATPNWINLNTDVQEI